ncbi:hypothetical protein [Runella sp.]|uniref:hypothetical protein n=1 Tax=Runella sp. TaxID=1960881 RepID=UPI003D0DDDA0
MKRKITIYKELNEPYEAMLKRGLEETPDQRFVRFFEERAKFRTFLGIKTAPQKKIVIRKVSWI